MCIRAIGLTLQWQYFNLTYHLALMHVLIGSCNMGLEVWSRPSSAYASPYVFFTLNFDFDRSWITHEKTCTFLGPQSIHAITHSGTDNILSLLRISCYTVLGPG